MPCGGPSIDFAYKKGEEIALALLSTLEATGQVTPLTATRPGLLTREDQLKARVAFVKAVQELVWLEHCDSF